MPDSDVLERNEELNKRVASLSANYTRRKVVDSLLAIIIGILVALVIILLLIDFDLDHHILNIDEKTDMTSITQIQLLCSHIPEKLNYVACVKVGPPPTIGVNK